MAKFDMKNNVLPWLCFFVSTTTLFCCTIPIVLVALGFGTALVVMGSQLPWLMVLGEYKFWIFLVSGIILLVTYWTISSPAKYCPTDPVLAEKCASVKKLSIYLFWTSVILWGVGFISAYLAQPVRDLFI